MEFPIFNIGRRQVLLSDLILNNHKKYGIGLRM